MERMVWMMRRGLLLAVLGTLLVSSTATCHASPTPLAPHDAQQWILHDNWDQDASPAFPADECPVPEARRHTADVFNGVSDDQVLVELKIRGVKGYRCDAALSIRGSHGALLYRASYWYGYARGPEQGDSQTLSVSLFVLGARPVVAVKQRFGPSMGSCGSCGDTTAVTFLVLRHDRPPAVRKFKSFGDAPLSYSVRHLSIDVDAWEALECHSCVYETVTPYMIDPQSSALAKIGDTTLVAPKPADESVPTQVVNHPLVRRPVWGPWVLTSRDGACAVTALSKSGMLVRFLSGSSMALMLGQLFPDDAAPWRTEQSTASRVKALEHDGALPSRITAYVDGTDQIDFSAGQLTPDGFMFASAAPTVANSQPLAGMMNAAALKGHFLVLDLMWGTNEWGAGAKFRRLIGMDISGGANAITQLLYCAGGN